MKLLPTQRWPLIAWLLIVAMVYINSADFQGASEQAESFQFNYQILIRLAVCAACGLFGLRFLPSSLARFNAFPGVIVLIFGLTAILTVPFSINPKYSIVAATCLWCLLVFLPAALDQLENQEFISAVTIGSIAYVLTCWVLYLVFPEIGTWREYITIDDYLDRMGGLGHPNTLGFYATCSLLLVLILARKGVVHPMWAMGWSIVWAATMYYCLSRTSIVLAVVGIVSIYSDVIWRAVGNRANVPFLLGTGLAGIVLILALAVSGDLDQRIESAVLSTSKSGDTDELTSLTGRSEIWEYGLRRWAERPMTGFGYGTQRFVMDEYSFHCHNIVINTLLGGGIFAGLSIVGMLAYLLYRMFHRPDPFLRAFIPLFLIGGIIESMINSPAPSLEMVIFFALVFWTQKDTPTSESEPTLSDLRRLGG